MHNHTFFDWYQIDKWREFYKNVLEKFCESKGIAIIHEVHYTSQHQVSEEVFNRTASLPQKRPQKENII